MNFKQGVDNFGVNILFGGGIHNKALFFLFTVLCWFMHIKEIIQVSNSE